MTGTEIKNILINAVSNFETVDNEYVDAKKLLQTNNLILYDIYIIYIDDKFNVYVEENSVLRIVRNAWKPEQYVMNSMI